MYKKMNHIHFVGIGGIGMSGIAELLLNLGYRVSGSDLKHSLTTERLAELGATISLGHKREGITGVDVVVTSTAIPEDNEEVVAAREQLIPVIKRAEMLAELMRLKKYGIAIAGSHGKTSTTSMVSWMMYQAGMDPTVVVGGKVDSLGGNAKLGAGEFLVAEADESDGSFLKLAPVIEVITNIDLEHLDFYHNLNELKKCFLEFIDKVPFYGAVIVCLDDKNIAAILPEIGKRVITYGLTAQADVHAEKIHFENGKMFFTVVVYGERKGTIAIAPPGRHNVYNALAAVCVGIELDLPFEQIQKGMESYQGVQRRMEVKGAARGVTVIDDYGHHPTEIRATLKAIKEAWPDKRLVVAFQPHRYSRTKVLFDDFLTCFHYADILIITDIYAAGETPLPDADSKLLVTEIKRHGQRRVQYVSDVDQLADAVEKELVSGDLFLTLGAGNIVNAGEKLLRLLEKDVQTE